jgi:hypothetical protein
LITNYKPVVTLPDGIKVFADWFPWIFWCRYAYKVLTSPL